VAADEPARRPDLQRPSAWRRIFARWAGLRGAQHVLAFEKPFDLRLADGEQAEDQRAMRNRLVAGRAQAA
jgi:hypothetical protein